MSCVDLPSNAVLARLRWRSRASWTPLSTVEILVEPDVSLTGSVLAIVMLASMDYLPKIFSKGRSGPNVTVGLWTIAYPANWYR